VPSKCQQLAFFVRVRRGAPDLQVARDRTGTFNDGSKTSLNAMRLGRIYCVERRSCPVYEIATTRQDGFLNGCGVTETSCTAMPHRLGHSGFSR
jgi:hypothetical protein